MAAPETRSPLALFDSIGRATVRTVSEWGYNVALLVEACYWLFAGAFRKQPVRVPLIMARMGNVGVNAIPIVAVLSFVIGVMLAIQGIHTLKTFGAESQVVVGIAFSVTREFGPLITGILVAGRSGSALAAELGTKQISQEVDALRVIGVNPVRYLVSPALLAMLVMLPCLTILADLSGLLGGAVYSAIEMDMTIAAYMNQTISILTLEDLGQGLVKSVVFAVIITLVGASNGFDVKGGAEGVGKATTRSVVLAITYIIIADMVFTFFMTR